MTGPQEFVVPKTYTVITRWQVNKNFLFPRGTPSSADDRSTRILGLRGSALITWWQIHKNNWFPRGTPSLHDDSFTKFFGSTTSTHIMWWQVNKFYLFHPHRVMTGAQEFCFLKSTRIFASRGSNLIVYNFYCTAYRASHVSLSSSTHEFWKSQYDMMIKVQFMRRSTLAKIMTQAKWGKRGKMLLVMREESFNWRKNRDTKHKWRIMNDGYVVSCTWLGTMWSSECGDGRDKIWEMGEIVIMCKSYGWCCNIMKIRWVIL